MDHLFFPLFCRAKEIKYGVKSPNNVVPLVISIDKDIRLTTSKALPIRLVRYYSLLVFSDKIKLLFRESDLPMPTC